ncbi:hypothetical protein ARMSODRAFT_1020982 [Armillaria solidipes]|uniref:Uncharacterized protein n=1 Tax=Armillaria solidipes TaxID=1076256 RepID=A0A2H3BLV6_9AGAR|nr:hypothetical protein ARMSODRAFT_1020982 [Armillaria solidipes]
MVDNIYEEKRLDARQRRRDEAYATLPEVTISAKAETGRVESSIAVPLQRIYIGQKPVISASLADTLCATFGVRQLLDKLNTTLGTSYTLDTPSLSSFLLECTTNNYDFGTAYCSFRDVWYTDDWSTIREELRKRGEEDQRERREALDGNCIVHPHTSPRRVWDLYSNRVVPTWDTSPSKELAPISHAWVHEKDRKDVWTRINGYEWPVPIPKDTNLDLIRIEMLNLGAEYVWLDVLCLKQKGGRRDDLREKEWELDVPTIGCVYYNTDRVYCYLSGLGRPLALKEGDLESDQCWFNRAWTLQEVGKKRIICGQTLDGPMQAKGDKDRIYETEILTRFYQKLRDASAVLQYQEADVFRALVGMQHRKSTKEVDKVMGLAFLLKASTIPAYSESQNLETAWTALVNTTSKRTRAVLFFHYPEPGNRGTKWRPSWDQVMTTPLPMVSDCQGSIDWTAEGHDHDRSWAPCIEKGLVRGLTMGGRRQHGELSVKDAHGRRHAFKITATHSHPIPEKTYTLIGDNRLFYWVVGQRLSGKKFEKVSVIKIANSEEGKKLKDLNIAKERISILL